MPPRTEGVPRCSTTPAPDPRASTHGWASRLGQRARAGGGHACIRVRRQGHWTDVRSHGRRGHGAAQGAYATNATDCPSHLCIKPAVQPGVSNDLDTGPYCTVRCNSDSDCNGQTRDFTNPNDTRCMKGFTCAIPFGVGKLCCAEALPVQRTSSRPPWARPYRTPARRTLAPPAPESSEV
jgi:hypothetical protein